MKHKKELKKQGQDMEAAEDRKNTNKLEPSSQYLCGSLNMMNVYLCFQFHVRGTCYRFLKVQKHHPAEEVPEFKRAGNWDNFGGSNVGTCLVCTLSTVHLLDMNLFFELMLSLLFDYLQTEIRLLTPLVGLLVIATLQFSQGTWKSLEAAL